MCKSDYTIEDFVLDRDFRSWVLQPTKSNMLFWEEYLEKHPHKRKDMLIARKLVINMSRFSFQADANRKEVARQNVLRAVRQLDIDASDKKVIPIHPIGTLLKPRERKKIPVQIGQFKKIVGILMLTFLSSFLLTHLMQTLIDEPIMEEAVFFEEHFAPPGVKSNLTLQDGSKVILNSGSRLKYLKNFEPHQRELELHGEAYFEVTTNPNRPFRVKTNNIITEARGTSFNIQAFKHEDINISLISGSVSVEIDSNEQAQQVLLRPGEMANIGLKDQHINKRLFDPETIMAWTKKTIVFDQANLNTIIRTLENWYGVEIHLQNKAPKTMAISGRFQDQTLKNVLIGLSHSADFNFEILKDQIYITFHR